MLPQGKTKHDDIEIKKLELLNSILMKELLESKDKITNLKEENEKLKAENLKLKNFQSTNDIDSHNKIERIKNEPLDIDSNEDNYQNPHKSTMDIIENTLNSTNKSTKNEENLSFQEEALSKSRTNDEFSKDEDEFSGENDKLSKITKQEVNHTQSLGKANFKCENSKNEIGKYNLNVHMKNIPIKVIPGTSKETKISKVKNQNQNARKKTSKNIGCDICGKSFIELRNLKNHKKSVHEGIKEFKCKLCEKFFTTKRRLEGHQKTFKGYCYALVTKKEPAKKHKCDICGKYLIDSRNLKNHIKFVHKGIKEFKCDSCEKFFATKQTLYNHKEKCS